jgi:hypothetical protein
MSRESASIAALSQFWTAPELAAVSAGTWSSDDRDAAAVVWGGVASRAGGVRGAPVLTSLGRSIIEATQEVVKAEEAERCAMGRGSREWKEEEHGEVSQSKFLHPQILT